MFIVGNLVGAVAEIADLILGAYMWIVIVAALLSWVNPDPYNPVVRFLYLATEPILRPIRKKVGTLGGIDISPMIVVLAIVFTRSFLVKSLLQASRVLR
ncbi:YggT family protein [Candidatus Magnetominusculus dajiuhuensis]|uniref:YggT family protein n=1 Tax=Candidatus Magnetominusculus dajiuhuensis TaxID=3137712 RepID=UPI003B43A828